MPQADPSVVIHPISQQEALQRMEKLYQLMFQMFEKATAYENVILVAGYAGFFALWSAVAGDLPREVTLWSVGLMGISLLAYVVFHILQMMTRVWFQYRMMLVVSQKLNDPDFHVVWSEKAGRAQRGTAFVMLIWPPILTICVATGLAGGGLVAFSSLYAALR